MAELIDMTHEELAEWLPPMEEDYINQRVGAGEDRAHAESHGRAQMEQLFPEGKPAEGQFPMKVVVDGTVVGHLWMGRPFGDMTGTWYVFNVEIGPEHRGKGHGRTAMQAAEEWSIAHGGTRIALNVFGPNTVARALYDSMGYEKMAIAMFKDLAPSA
jgi:ribosomal protein S18 acetylase RimI-like enzyme